MSLVKGTGINLAARLSALVLVLLITVFTARLGTEQQGTFALFTSVEAALLALFSGFGVALARQVSHHGQAPRALLSAMLWACVCLGFVAALLLVVVSQWGPKAYAPLWLLALVAPLLLLAPNATGWWLGEGRMAPMALVALAPPALVLAALLLLWALDLTTLLNVIAAWVLARLVVNLGTLIVLAQSGRLAAPDWPGLRALLPFVATIGLSNVIALLNYRVGLFVVERQMGLSAAGVYSIAVVVAELLWLVSGSLTQAAYSRIGNSDASKAAATTVRVVQLSIVALLVAAPLVVLAAQQLIPWLIGAAYATSLTPLLCLLPGVLLFGAASALSAYFTNHAGTPQVPAQVAAVSLALNAALSLMLVPRLGLLGAAWGASVAYGISVCWLAWRFARHAGLPLHSLLVPGPQLWADVRRLMSA